MHLTDEELHRLHLLALMWKRYADHSVAAAADDIGRAAEEAQTFRHALEEICAQSSNAHNRRHLPPGVIPLFPNEALDSYQFGFFKGLFFAAEIARKALAIGSIARGGE